MLPAYVLAAALALLLPAASAPATPHDLRITRASLRIGPDATFRLDLICDLDALALGAAPDADDAELAAAIAGMDGPTRAATEEALRQTLLRRVRVFFDGVAADLTVSFPESGSGEQPLGERPDPAPDPPAPPAAAEPLAPTELGLTARFTGDVPDDGREVVVRASRAFPPVHLTILDARGGGSARQILVRGAESDPFRLDGGGAISAAAAARQYLRLGFVHILPGGWDHVLFVLGLFLAGGGWRPLLLQVSAFTVAHTMTLGLSALGALSLAPGIVEPLIALSIAYVGIENVLSERMRPWRPAVVFGFGLLHGLGFAGVLGDIGLPAGQRAVALLSFNIGVELGQLAVIGAAFLLLARWRAAPWYRSRVAVPLSLAIAAAGGYWFAIRIGG